MAEIILIVHDNELKMNLINDLLQSKRDHVLQTGAGKEALAIARAGVTHSILTDIKLWKCF